jgi:hypothetical protein
MRNYGRNGLELNRISGSPGSCVAVPAAFLIIADFFAEPSTARALLAGARSVLVCLHANRAGAV